MDVTKELLSRISRIVSDGDWDGVTASAILVRFAREHGIEPTVEYPKISKLHLMRFDHVVGVEITPTKTDIRNSLIFDHHQKVEGYGNIWVFDQTAPSVAEIVARTTGISLDRKFMNAVAAVDQGEVHKNDLTELLWKAFQSDVMQFPREEFTCLLADGNVPAVLKRCKKLAEGYEKIERRGKELEKNATLLLEEPETFYFIYRHILESSPKRVAMIDLEQKHDIVVAIGINEENRPVAGSIGTMREHINLNGVFVYLREHGYKAGGRKNIGGFQLSNSKTLREVIDDIKSAIINTVDLQ